MAAPAPQRRRRWLPIVLGALALAPFSVLLTESGPDGETLILSEADEAMLADGLRLVAPRFTGRTAKGEPYAVTADWALPDGPDPSEVALSGVRAEARLEAGRDATLTAKDGKFHVPEQRLVLYGAIRGETSDGYWFETSEAEADGAAKRITAPAEVRAGGPEGTLRADSMEAYETKETGERVVIFRGGVTLTLNPPNAADPKPDAADGATAPETGSADHDAEN